MQLSWCLPKWSGLTYLQPCLLRFISLNAWLWMDRLAICLNNSFLFSTSTAVLETIKASLGCHLPLSGTSDTCRITVPPPCWHPLPATVPLLSHLTSPPEVHLPGQDAGSASVNTHSQRNRRPIRKSSSPLLLGNPRVTDVTSCEF